MAVAMLAVLVLGMVLLVVFLTIALPDSEFGRFVLVVVDGRRRGHSSGMTNFELALALVRLGAVSGAALDGGGSSTMAFDGQLLNTPSGTSERAVSEALLMVYSGIHAPLPSVAVVSRFMVSPNS